MSYFCPKLATICMAKVLRHFPSELPSEILDKDIMELNWERLWLYSNLYMHDRVLRGKYYLLYHSGEIGKNITKFMISNVREAEFLLHMFKNSGVNSGACTRNARTFAWEELERRNYLVVWWCGKPMIIKK